MKLNIIRNSYIGVIFVLYDISEILSTWKNSAFLTIIEK